MRIKGLRGAYKGREITGLLDYNEETNTTSFTSFYRIEGEPTKTFFWSTEIDGKFNFDIEFTTQVVKQITAILGAEELAIFSKLFQNLSKKLFTNLEGFQ